MKDKISILKDSTPRLRFAPSPTGGLHIGTARTALFNWLAARNMKGRLLLRIEDTDIKRSDKLYEELIIKDLKWIGLDWDEFYRQSERIEIYKKYADKLLNENKAYRCFCSAERLEELKNKLYSEGKMSKYDNRCRDLTSEEIGINLRSEKSYTIRFKVDQCEIKFNDLIRDEIKFNSEVIGDFIILKSDGTPSYNFAVVIDDSDMKITHVLRGEDHITNTASQIMLFKSLGFSIPQFAHLSMILGKDGAKLSKRHGSQTISEFREEGYLSEAIANYLALLSWAPRNIEEIFEIKDIVKSFKIEDISKSPAIFDLDKLNWINGNHIRKKSNDELYNLIVPFVLRSGILEERQLEEGEESKLKLLKCIDTFKDHLKVLSGFPELIRDFFIDDVIEYSYEAAQMLKLESSVIVMESILKKLNNFHTAKAAGKDFIFNEEDCKNILSELADDLKEFQIKGKNLYMPIRSALTGKTHGPELPKVLTILGIETCIGRIRQAINFISSAN